MSNQQTNIESKIRQIAYAGDREAYEFSTQSNHRFQVQFIQNQQFNQGKKSSANLSLWNCQLGIQTEPQSQSQPLQEGQGQGAPQTGTAMAMSSKAWQAPIPVSDTETQQYVQACINKFMSTHEGVAVYLDTNNDDQNRVSLVEDTLSQMAQQRNQKQLNLDDRRFIIPTNEADQYTKLLTGFDPNRPSS